MFRSHSEKFNANVSKTIDIVHWQEELRNLIYPPSNQPEEAAENVELLETFRTTSPPKIDWRIHDHCAAISRLYALFEEAICEIVTDYVRLTPKYFPKFEDLREPFRKQYRIGIGTILTKWAPSNSLFPFAEENIAAGLADGLRGYDKYNLLADAFLLTSENFRWSTVNKILSDIGIDKPMSLIEKDQHLSSFKEQSLMDLGSPANYLDSFVRARNEAAHGTITNVLGIKKLKEYAEFISIIVAAIGRLLCSDLIKQGLKTGETVLSAKVIKKFSDNVVVVEAVTNTSLTVGDILYVGKKNVIRAEVVSIRTGSTQHDKIELGALQRFGLKMDVPLKENFLLYRIKPETDPG